MARQLLLAHLLSISALALSGCSGSSKEDPDAAPTGGIDAAQLVDAAPGIDSAPGTVDASTTDAGGEGSCVPGDDSCTDGDVCRPALGTNNLVCQTPGAVEMGQPCGAAGVDDCVAVGVCYDIWATGTKTCEPFCTANAATIACPGDGTMCVAVYGDQPAGVCLGNDCTPPATGCPDGKKCAIANGEVWACMPAGDVQVGGSCAVEWCVAGAQCDPSSVCKTLCDTTDDCAAGTHCEAVGLDNFPAWGMCEEGCDVTSQTGCTNGEACYTSDSVTGETVCKDGPPGALAVGADCSGPGAECVAGVACVQHPDDITQYTCRAYCDDAHTCTTGTCQAIGVWFPALQACQ